MSGFNKQVIANPKLTMTHKTPIFLTTMFLLLGHLSAIGQLYMEGGGQNLVTKDTLIDGIKFNNVSFYGNGQTCAAWNTINNKIDGCFIKWCENGNIRGKEFYKNGELNGTCYYWFWDKKRFTYGDYKNCSKTLVEEITYKEGVKNGKYILWGAPRQELTERGILKWEEGHYINDKKNGKWYSWDYNHYAITRYRNGKTTRSKEYNYDGKLLRKEKIKNDKPSKQSRF